MVIKLKSATRLKKQLRSSKVRRTDQEVIVDLVSQLITSVCVDEDTGCWLWQGLLWSNGYARLRRVPRRIKGVSSRAHIFMYTLARGRVPVGLFVCHRCDVKHCINPKHLWLGTNQDNQRDASSKGVFAKYWTVERRMQQSIKYSGEDNPMYGRSGELAPAYGRTGRRHPMFGKRHSEESKLKISKSVLKTLTIKRGTNV